MSEVQTITVPHLRNSRIGYRFGRAFDASLPTLVLVNSFSTSSELYQPQFTDETLSTTANLLAIELFGHGQTRTSYEQFTYWDTALANLQVLEALGISEAFVLGTSQGGWVAARMAMLEPERIRGILPLGTSMDYESQRSRDLGCWDGSEVCTPLIDSLSQPVGDDWTVDDEFTDFILSVGIGDQVSAQERERWRALHKANYQGDDGRKRLRMCAINLRDRDGLRGRLDAVKCPVLWMQGTHDQVYSVPNAEEEITMFTNAADAQLRVVDNGQHFLSASDPDVVNRASIDFIKTWT
ncbi:alpha/beta hydrolase [Aquisalimonas lutea]|uniref:alpha/beta fold hydrolase n=1 Tax=Aquisalimonas lutea TaxID=1327750 RepID=UPI0025B2A789|nr:alpha/beta hydrolase [Aquisalimonas lutea]MDN3519790.1 alpha/beta hydrolase [Aquisalimonas lutea]